MTATASRLDPTSPWLLIALAAGLVVGSAGWMGALAETDTGMDLSETADQRASAWDDRARLVGVGAAESTEQRSHDHNHSDHENDHAWTHTSEGDLGDGQAGAWTYTYEADEQALRVTVAANGTVLNETQTPASNRTPITGWNVDASEAVETVRENDEGWERVDARWAFYALHQPEPDRDPLWVLGVGGNATLQFAAVNATTGEYIASWGAGAGFHGWWGTGWSGSWNNSWNNSWDNSWDGSWNQSGNASEEASTEEPPAEGGEFEGTLTALDPDHEHTFEIQHEGHDSLELELELDGSVWNAVRANVTGPQARQVQLEASADEPTEEASLAEPAAGTYEVTVAFEQGPMVLEEGIAQEYELHWCAPGDEEPGWDGHAEAC